MSSSNSKYKYINTTSICSNANSYALTVAYQDNVLGENDTSRSRGRFKLRENRELNINRFYIQHRGYTLPQPQPDPQYILSTYVDDGGRTGIAYTNYYLQRWAESELYASGGQYWGGKESLSDWIKRGPYYHFHWPKAANSSESKATEVIISQEFSRPFITQETHPQLGSINEERPQLLLFDHYRKHFSIKVEHGKIISVTPSSKN